MAPTPATAAGTADPTARNLEATATPHDSPSADRATIEKVMPRTLAASRPIPGCPQVGLKLEDDPVTHVLDRLGFPSVGEHRRFVTAVAVDAVGSGVFMPVCMLYFLVTTELSLVQVGAALSIAAAVALPSGPVLGGIVDRYGAKNVLLAGNALQFVGYAAYLVTDSFLGVTLWTVVVTVGRTAFWGSYGNIVAAISAPGEREKWFGFLGALRNVGFALGGLLSGLAITIGTPGAFAAVVAANAASFALGFVLLLTVP